MTKTPISLTSHVEGCAVMTITGSEKLRRYVRGNAPICPFFKAIFFHVYLNICGDCFIDLKCKKYSIFSWVNSHCLLHIVEGNWVNLRLLSKPHLSVSWWFQPWEESTGQRWRNERMEGWMVPVTWYSYDTYCWRKERANVPDMVPKLSRCLKVPQDGEKAQAAPSFSSLAVPDETKSERQSLCCSNVAMP